MNQYHHRSGSSSAWGRGSPTSSQSVDFYGSSSLMSLPEASSSSFDQLSEESGRFHHRPAGPVPSSATKRTHNEATPDGFRDERGSYEASGGSDGDDFPERCFKRLRIESGGSCGPQQRRPPTPPAAGGSSLALASAAGAAPVTEPRGRGDFLFAGEGAPGVGGGFHARAVSSDDSSVLSAPSVRAPPAHGAPKEYTGINHLLGGLHAQRLQRRQHQGQYQQCDQGGHPHQGLYQQGQHQRSQQQQGGDGQETQQRRTFCGGMDHGQGQQGHHSLAFRPLTAQDEQRQRQQQQSSPRWRRSVRLPSDSRLY